MPTLILFGAEYKVGGPAYLDECTWTGRYLTEGKRSENFQALFDIEKQADLDECMIACGPTAFYINAVR